MAQRRDPSTSSGGGISADPGDNRYRSGGGAGGRPSRPAASSGGGGGRGVGTSIVLAILIAGLAGAGWFIANQHQLIGKQQAALDAADNRLKLLEDRLRMTDEALSDTGDETKEKINFWESEIRKLWAVSNERNKKWIEDNRANIGKLGKQVGEVAASQRTMKSAVDRHDKSLAQQQDIIDQLASVELQFQQLISSQRDLVDRVNALNQQVSGVRTDLAGRVAENEQAITAIDAYRRQINNRLNDLERRLAPSPAG